MQITRRASAHGLLLAFFAVVGQVWFQPAHILHHLEEGACQHPSTTTHSECAHCAVFHSGVASVPVVETSISSPLTVSGVIESSPVGTLTLLPVLSNSRAPPIDPA